MINPENIRKKRNVIRSVIGMAILVAGGAGYIGSHTCAELLEAGHEVVIADNLVNSSPRVLERIGRITGKTVPFYQADVRDEGALEDIFRRHDIRAVINFAGLKAVGESVRRPLEYYHNNVVGTLALCRVMEKFGVKNMIFSSSATVYGDPAEVPITESCPLGAATNPYGRTKQIIEQILTDLHTADPEWNTVLLRYFNPIGAHESGLLGEDPRGIPNNLVPYIGQVAVGKRTALNVFGGDYPTRDGTGVRDYIHVTDLAKGHLAALARLTPGSGVSVYNLGTGVGYSVLDVLHAYERACGKHLPYVMCPRRPGDVAECWCDASKAARELGWRAEKGLDEMCADAWRWQSMNPEGYGG